MEHKVVALFHWSNCCGWVRCEKPDAVASELNSNLCRYDIEEGFGFKVVNAELYLDYDETTKEQLLEYYDL